MILLLAQIQLAVLTAPVILVTMELDIFVMVSFNCIYLHFSNPSGSDINECASNNNNCHDEASCTNSIGSFDCNCNNGYFGNGTFCSGEY